MQARAGVKLGLAVVGRRGPLHWTALRSMAQPLVCARALASLTEIMCVRDRAAGLQCRAVLAASTSGRARRTSGRSLPMPAR